MHRAITPAEYEKIVARERPFAPTREGGYASGKRIKGVPPGDEIMGKWGG